MAFPAFQERLRQLFWRAKFDGGVVRKSTPTVETAQVWNNPNETFVGITNNILNKQSATNSLVERWQVNGVDVASIRKDGTLLGITKIGDTGKTEITQFTVPYGGTNFQCNGQSLFYMSAWNVILQGGRNFGFASGYANAGFNVALSYDSAGIIQLNSGTANDFRDLKLRNLIGTGNLSTGTVAKSADYTATTSDGTIEVDASGAARTITLFACSANAGKILVIKKIDSGVNAVTVDGNASETIDGATTISLASQYSTAILQVNAAGTGWNKLGGV